MNYVHGLEQKAVNLFYGNTDFPKLLHQFFGQFLGGGGKLFGPAEKFGFGQFAQIEFVPVQLGFAQRGEIKLIKQGLFRLGDVEGLGQGCSQKIDRG